MKNYLFFSLAILIWFNSSIVNAGEYVGEFCFGVVEANNAMIFKMGIEHMGDTHYLFSGVKYGMDGKAKAMSGNAELIDNSIMMSFTTVHTGVDDIRGAYVTIEAGEILLDPKTFSGTLSEFDADAYVDGSDHMGDNYVNLVLIPCI